jgi:pyruvate/2-oxoacid:ferredoxin oxidoreductase alpha subunit
MKTKDFETIDGNEAAARVAYQLNEVIAINPITPASSNSKSVVGSAFTTAGR